METEALINKMLARKLPDKCLLRLLAARTSVLIQFKLVFLYTVSKQMTIDYSKITLTSFFCLKREARETFLNLDYLGKY